MKAMRNTIRIKTIMMAITAVVMIVAFSSCATKAKFMDSSVVPGATGSVTVKTDKNDNYVIKVQIDNLATPDKLDPPKTAYVVWMETENNITKNIGQINSSSGMLSKKLTASFETVSAVKPTKIFITAEKDPSVQYPVDKVVLTTSTF